MEPRTWGKCCLGISRGHKASRNNSSTLPRCSQHSSIELLSLSLWFLVYLEGAPKGQRDADSNFCIITEPPKPLQNVPGSGSATAGQPQGELAHVRANPGWWGEEWVLEGANIPSLAPLEHSSAFGSLTLWLSSHWKRNPNEGHDET